MSFIAWPPFAHLRRNGEQSGSREIRKNRSGPPGRAMSRGFPFLPRADYSPVLAFHAELHNSAGFCTGRSDVQCVTQREGKKPCPSPYPKIPPKATGLSHAYFQSHLADSRTGFTRSVRSYPPIPI